MKKFILILGVTFLISNGSKAQQEKQNIASTTFMLQEGNNVIKDDPSFNLTKDPGNDTVKDYDYYMRKKRDNLNAGLATLGIGVVFSGLGAIIGSNTDGMSDDVVIPAVFLITGAVSGIVSIPLMIMATVFGHKAKLELSKQKTGFGVPPGVSKDIVGLTVKIGLGN